MVLLEVCAERLDSVVNARLGGAQRIELCSALSEGGITPSVGLIEGARRLGPPLLNVLIRPRGGNFVYTDDEVDCMVADINMCCSMGVDGVVMGALTPEGDIDVDACRHMMDAARDMPVTFHRAFDRCRNPHKALEQIIGLGCRRLLTSGQQIRAIDGLGLIKSLIDQAAGRIIVMPGAGVTEENAAQIITATGATEIHGSLRTNTDAGLVTDAQKVKQLILNVKR